MNKQTCRCNLSVLIEAEGSRPSSLSRSSFSVVCVCVCVSSWRRSGTSAPCPVWRNSTCPVTPCASSQTTEPKSWPSLETAQQRYATKATTLLMLPLYCYYCYYSRGWLCVCFCCCAVTANNITVLLLLILHR